MKKSTKKAVNQPASEAQPPAADHDATVVVEPVDASNEEPVAATTDSVADSTAAESECKNKAETDESVVVLDTQLTLPQPVDTSGITCSYQDGLLRIHVPIVAPALGEEHRELIGLLEQEAKSAAELVTTLEQQLKEQRAKAREAHMNLHSAKVGVHRAAHVRRHALTLE